jgi:hypothetical protein
MIFMLAKRVGIGVHLMIPRRVRAALWVVALSWVQAATGWAAAAASRPCATDVAMVTRPLRVPEGVPLGKVDPPFAIVGETGTWRLEFTLARKIEGAKTLVLEVCAGRHIKGEFAPLQANDAARPGYLSARLADGSPLRASRVGGQKGAAFRLDVSGKPLPAGAKIIVVLGDTSAGGLGTTAPDIRLLNKFISLSCPQASPATASKRRQEDSNTDSPMVGVCVMNVVGGELEHLRAYMPSQCKPGQPVEVLARPEDQFSNLSWRAVRDVDVFLGQDKLETTVRPVESSTCARLAVRLPAAGSHRLRIVDRPTGKECLTNPTTCRAGTDRYNMYWGILHGHTEVSDGWGSIDNYYRQMRDECGLDFGAISDHDHLGETLDSHWAMIGKAARTWNEPGRFVTLLGYEWAKWRKNGDGDRNVYYLQDDQPMFRSDNGRYPRPADLFRALSGKNAVVIPHHPASDGNFCDYKDHDPEHERFIEIHQARGCYECPAEMGNPLIAKPDRPDGQLFKKGFVSDALAIGWRVGFTAGGDDHRGTAGTDRPFHEQDGKAIYAGSMAVLATERTREAIWDGLWNRRVIATSGPRVLLQVDLNGHPIGSELKASTETSLRTSRRISVRFLGTAPVQRIDVIRNNKVIHTTGQTEFVWEDKTPLADALIPAAKYCNHPFCFYYVRVVQTDGQAAWASPVWIDP